MTKTITIPEYKWKKIESFMEKLERHFTREMTEDEWVTEKEFKDLTGIRTKEQLRHWRNQHPTLWKAEKSFLVVRDGKEFTSNRGFLYNFAEYKRGFKSPLCG